MVGGMPFIALLGCPWLLSSSEVCSSTPIHENQTDLRAGMLFPRYLCPQSQVPSDVNKHFGITRKSFLKKMNFFFQS